MDDCDPLSYPVDPRAIRGARAARPRRRCASHRPKTSASARSISEIREVFREQIAAMRHLFRSCDEVTFDFGEADRCFDVIRAQNFVAALPRRLREGPELARPNVRANYEMAAGMTLADARLGARRADAHLPALPAAFRDYDLVLAPTTPVSPFPWTQLYLAEMDGKPLRNYYHWLALTYVITLVTNPAISLPCGVRSQGMPFGLQVTGRFARRPRAARRRRGAWSARSPASRASAGRARTSQNSPAVRRPQVAGDASAREKGGVRRAKKATSESWPLARLPSSTPTAGP